MGLNGIISLGVVGRVISTLAALVSDLNPVWSVYCGYVGNYSPLTPVIQYSHNYLLFFSANSQVRL